MSAFTKIRTAATITSGEKTDGIKLILIRKILKQQKMFLVPDPNVKGYVNVK